MEEESVINNYKKIPIPDFLPLIIDIYLDISPCLPYKKVFIRNEDDKNLVELDTHTPTTSTTTSSEVQPPPPILPTTPSSSHRQKKKIILLERWRLSLT